MCAMQVDNGNYLSEYRRRQIVKAYKRGWNMRQIAEAQGCSTGTVHRWVTRALDGEGMQTRERRPHNGRAPRQVPEHIEDLVCFYWLMGLHNYSAIARRVTPELHPDFGKGGSPGMEWMTVKNILQRRGLL